MTNRIGNRIIDTESIKSAAREWGGAYALLFSLQSLAYTATALWFGITDPPSDEFYPAFAAILRDIGIGGLASVVTTMTMLEGAQSIMIISATILKPRERRIREEEREKGREEMREEAQAQVAEAVKAAEAAQEARLAEAVKAAEAAQEARLAEAVKAAEAAQEARLAQEAAQTVARTLELERAAWQAWHERSELARAKGEEPPPPPFFGSRNGQSG